MGLHVEPGYIGQALYEHPVELDRNILEGIFGRTGAVRYGDFQASQGVGTRAIAVSAGRAHLLGVENAQQGGYFAWSDAVETFLLAAAVGNPRIDSIILRVVDDQYGTITGDPRAEFEVVQGVAAGSPVARADSHFNIGGPAYVPGAWWRVADVRVNVADTGSIPPGQITTNGRYVRTPGGAVVCTSTTRPTDPAEGDVIWQSDTKSAYQYNATSAAWRFISPSGNAKGINNARTTDTVASSSFANFAGTHSFSFTKLSSDGYVEGRLFASQYAAASLPCLVELAIQINGVDRVVFGMQYTANNQRHCIGGEAVFTAAEVPIGVYTVRARWRRVGTGTATAAPVDDWLSLRVKEVGPPI